MIMNGGAEDSRAVGADTAAGMILAVIAKVVINEIILLIFIKLPPHEQIV
jgi:hypothetical protein